MIEETGGEDGRNLVWQISENNLRDNTVIVDNVYLHTKIDFVNNGILKSDDYYMTSIIRMMYDIASKYDTCGFSNFYY